MNRQDYDNVRDDEVIFIGGDKGRNTSGNKPPRRPKWLIPAITLAVLAAVALIVVCGRGEKAVSDEQTGCSRKAWSRKAIL